METSIRTQSCWFPLPIHSNFFRFCNFLYLVPSHCIWYRMLPIAGNTHQNTLAFFIREILLAAGKFKRFRFSGLMNCVWWSKKKTATATNESRVNMTHVKEHKVNIIRVAIERENSFIWKHHTKGAESTHKSQMLNCESVPYKVASIHAYTVCKCNEDKKKLSKILCTHAAVCTEWKKQRKCWGWCFALR